MVSRADSKPFSLRGAASGALQATALTDREREVLSWVRDHGPITRSALIRVSGLSGPAVFRATEDLTAKGYLLIGAPVAAGRGQPSHEVQINPNAAFSLGLSIMTDFAEAAIMDITGKVRATANITAPGMLRKDILAKAADFLAEQEACGLSRSAFTGVGVALAAFFVDEHLLNPAAELDDWALIDLRGPVEMALGLPAIIENSASAAAVGESLLGVGRHTPTFAYLNFAAGFGGGIILDRQLWRGLSGNAGEFAAVLTTAGAFVPKLETLRERVAAHGRPTTGIDDLVARVSLDWPGVEDWLPDAARSVKLLSRIIAETMDVGTVVVGGRLPQPLAARLAEASAISQNELDQIQRRSRGRPAPRIVPAEASARATAVGAASLPLAARIFSSPVAR